MGNSIAGYDKNVFINCPFDDEYINLFRAMVFAVMECGFTPRCALEAANSGQVRVDKIMSIIEECRFGIHDISRTELDAKHSLPRFNMPFELGIFVGCHRFGGRKHNSKCCIVLDRENYRYQKFISDIAGQDISSHDGKAEIIVERIRDWLSAQPPGEEAPIPCGEEIFLRYEQFQESLPRICKKLKLKPNKLTFRDLGFLIKYWSRWRLKIAPTMPEAEAAAKLKTTRKAPRPKRPG